MILGCSKYSVKNPAKHFPKRLWLIHDLKIKYKISETSAIDLRYELKTALIYGWRFEPIYTGNLNF